MRKLIFLLFVILCASLKAQENVGYRVNYYDTVEFKSPIINQNGDTIDVLGNSAAADTVGLYHSNRGVLDGISAYDTNKWGNALQSESDPVFSVSVAAAISANDTTRWGQSGGTMTADQINDSLITGNIEPSTYVFNNNGTLNGDSAFYRSVDTGYIEMNMQFNKQAWVVSKVTTYSVSITIDLDNSLNHFVTLTGDANISLSNKRNGGKYEIRILQDGSGGHTPTLASSFGSAMDGSADISETASAINLINISCFDINSDGDCNDTNETLYMNATKGN